MTALLREKSGSMAGEASQTEMILAQVESLPTLPSVAMRDKEEAYSELVSQLVADVTHDLRPTWIKQ